MAKDDEKVVRDEVTSRGEGPRAFATLLTTLHDGELHGELTEELHALNKRLEEIADEHGKAKGSITISLSIEVERKGVAMIDATVTVKAPRPKRNKYPMYVTKGSNLTTENPRQQKLPLREVPKRAAAEAPAKESEEARSV